MDVCSWSDRVRRLAEVTGWGDREFGGRIGVSGVTVCRWRTGRTVARSVPVVRVIEALEVVYRRELVGDGV